MLPPQFGSGSEECGSAGICFALRDSYWGLVENKEYTYIGIYLYIHIYIYIFIHTYNGYYMGVIPAHSLLTLRKGCVAIGPRFEPKVDSSIIAVAYQQCQPLPARRYNLR